MQRCCYSYWRKIGFPTIWMPSTELRDLRALLLHRHQWVRMRTRVQNALRAIAIAHEVRRGHTLWNREGQALLASLPLAPHSSSTAAIVPVQTVVSPQDIQHGHRTLGRWRCG
jgi:hypothetical protein